MDISTDGISDVKAIVPVVVGSVNVALPFLMDAMVGVVNVLFVNVSVPVNVASVRAPVPVGTVISADELFLIFAITGVVSVLFVSVCVKAFVTISSFAVIAGRVNCLLLELFITGVLRVGDVSVLFVNVCVPVVVTIPDVAVLIAVFI